MEFLYIFLDLTRGAGSITAREAIVFATVPGYV